MASSDSDSTGEVETVVVARSPRSWAADVKKRLIDATSWPHRPGGRPRPPTIFRIPDDIRNCDRSAYEPQVISIGPYHHSASAKQSLHMYKSYCVRYLLSLHRSEQVACELLHDCLARLASLSPRIRRCYSEGDIGLSDEQLSELMLLDGAFIIRLLFADGLLLDGYDDCTASDVEEDPDGCPQITIDMRDDMIRGHLLGKSWIRNILKYDILKLENQIPFLVIEEMLKILEIPFSHDSLAPIALQYFSDLQLVAPTASCAGGCKRFFHLLHLFHSCVLVPTGKDHDKLGSVINPAEVLQRAGLQIMKKMGKSNTHDSISEERVPNATELQGVGLKFANKKDAKSFLDISFKGGVLMIPPLHIVDHTDSLFRNLIAFEQLCPFVESQVMAYIVLMDCLIDTAQDVSILRSHGIIDNMLSTDQAAADLFNNFKNNGHFTLDNNYLRDVFLGINNFRRTRWRLWLASLNREYLANPWMTLSVIAAIFLLGLTFVQAFFGVYAYYRPPKGNG